MRRWIGTHSDARDQTLLFEDRFRCRNFHDYMWVPSIGKQKDAWTDAFDRGMTQEKDGYDGLRNPDTRTCIANAKVGSCI